MVVELRVVLGRNVRRFRNDRGWSQEELGYRSSLHRTYISHIERAQRNVSIDQIERLAIGLEVAPADLFSAEMNA